MLRLVLKSGPLKVRPAFYCDFGDFRDFCNFGDFRDFNSIRRSIRISGGSRDKRRVGKKRDKEKKYRFLVVRIQPGWKPIENAGGYDSEASGCRVRSGRYICGNWFKGGNFLSKKLAY